MKYAASMRRRDRLVIKSLVRRLGPLSRAKIHELTNLRNGEITRITHELLNEGWILPAGRADNPTGRKQALLRLNEEHCFVVGVGFDDENVLAGTMDLRPRLKSLVRTPTRLDGGVEGLNAQLIECAREAIQKANVSPKSLLGIGVAGSGLVDRTTGTFVMSSTLDFFKNVPLENVFESEFGLPTIVENLTRAKAIAERVIGAGAMAKDMIYIEYGRTGIGAGIIIDGCLVRGAAFTAGEFGHTHIMEDGPACECGSFGCLEAVAGASALRARIRKAIAEGATSQALALAGNDPAEISGWTVLEAAKLGDKACTAIVEQAATSLGLGLANLVNLFNPSVLILDERLSLAGNSLLDQVVKIIRRQALVHATDDLVVLFGKLSAEASVLGIGCLILEDYFEIPTLKPPRFMIEPIPAPIEAARAS